MDPEDPVPFAASGQLLDELPAAAVDALVEAAGPGSGSPLLSLELRLLGGALTRAAPDAGALGSLEHAFLTFAVGMVIDPEMGAAVNRQMDVVANALERWDSGVKFANFADVPIDPRMCYPPETFDRLQQVKARYDPGRPLPGQPADPICGGRGVAGGSTAPVEPRARVGDNHVNTELSRLVALL